MKTEKAQARGTGKLLDSFEVSLRLAPGLPGWLEDAVLERCDELELRRHVEDFLTELLFRSGVKDVTVQVEGA